jgi:hypothetical protein
MNMDWIWGKTKTQEMTKGHLSGTDDDSKIHIDIDGDEDDVEVPLEIRAIELQNYSIGSNFVDSIIADSMEEFHELRNLSKIFGAQAMDHFYKRLMLRSELLYHRKHLTSSSTLILLRSLSFTCVRK